MNAISTFSRRNLLKGAALAGAALLLHKPAALLAAVTAETVTQSKLLMGTIVSISVAHADKSLAEEAMGRAFESMVNLECQLTRHAASAPLGVLKAQGNLLDAPRDLMILLDKAKRIHALTNGAFDITVAPVLDLFRARQNPQGRMRLDATELAEARNLVAADQVFMAPDHVRLGRKGMSLTLDGIAKGHIADKASEVLSQCGVTDHLVNAGGDIRAHGRRGDGSPWHVAIEHPTKQGRIAASLNLHGAIATSGSYEIFYDATREHHHIIDPALKQSPQHMVSVSVTAPTTLEADALATALSVMPVGHALRLMDSLPGRECCLLSRDGQIIQSRAWGKA